MELFVKSGSHRTRSESRSVAADRWPLRWAFAAWLGMSLVAWAVLANLAWATLTAFS